MKYIDMHVHTNISDGIYTPSQLVEYAILKGLNGLAITDHDTVDGIDEAIKYSHNKDDFIILPGIEFSSELKGTEVHILGYNINHHNKFLKKTLSFLQRQREDRIFRIIEKLKRLHIDISCEEIYNIFGKLNLGRPHIARFLIEKGYVKNMKEAFVKYLGAKAPAYVERYKITPLEAIQLIKSSGGFSVVAHPKSINSDNILLEVLKDGIDGIEVYHPIHNSTDRKKYLNMANKYNLIVTAGSDFHAPPSKIANYADLGDEKTNIKYIKEFINN